MGPGALNAVEFGTLSLGRRAELEGDEHDPFDAAGSTLAFQPKQRHVALADADGRLVASTGMLVVEVEVARERFPVVGIGGVIVNARHRGRGLAREVVQTALARAASLGPAFALLFCHPDRRGLYHRLAFAELTVSVRVRQPGGYATMPLRTMWRPLQTGAIWPDGPVTVCGLPF